MPRLAAPARSLLRRAALARLRAGWRSGALELELPGGELVRLGGDNPDGARLGDAGSAGVRPGSVPRVRVHDDRFFLRLVLRGEMGAGESFVAGEWSSDDVVGVARAFLRATGGRGLESPLTRLAQLPALARHRRAANTRTGSERNVHAHYDLGNAFYRLFLDDETMAYSCAIYPSHGPAPSLAAAQERKLERLCELLALAPHDHLLEIGCGWGGMAMYAARTRGCRVTAITVSREQYELASARVAAAGLSDRVTVSYRDYRDLTTTFAQRRGDNVRGFDKIVSIEMLEAVGYEFLPRYFATCARVLEPGGRFALQSITMPDERFDAYRRRVDWMQTYIFPGTLIPSLGAIRAASPMLELADVCDIGPSYAPTLAAWRERFVAQLPAVRELGFDEPFIRTWLLYLMFSEAAFAERTLGDHQLLFTCPR
jgi:cyclopropane-fatty-acyl-phospholipid synthase